MALCGPSDLAGAAGRAGASAAAYYTHGAPAGRAPPPPPQPWSAAAVCVAVVLLAACAGAWAAAPATAAAGAWLGPVTKVIPTSALHPAPLHRPPPPSSPTTARPPSSAHWPTLSRSSAAPLPAAAPTPSDATERLVGPTLLVSFLSDAASVSVTKALRDVAGPWQAVAPGQWRQGDVVLWERPESPVLADGLDDLLAESVGTRPSEVIFLSRHASSTCIPALCVHPIGIPDPGANRSAGGRPGQCPPPAPRLAAAYRLLREEAREAGLEGFEVSLEATHHGPWLTTPAMFVEVGSCEQQWGNPEAAAVWARTLARLLGLAGHAPGVRPWPALSVEERLRATAVVALGGGHYHPAVCDIASATAEHVYLGHLLATYSLGEVDGHLEAAVDAAVDATRRAYPGVGQLVVFVNKKSFKAHLRDAVLRHLQARGLTYVTSKTELLRLCA